MAFFQAAVGDVAGDFAGPFSNQATHAAIARSEYRVTATMRLRAFGCVSDEAGGVAAIKRGTLFLNGVSTGLQVTIAVGQNSALLAISVDVFPNDLLTVRLDDNAVGFLSWYLTN